jgi:methylenetetrahydrofolate dehydrogenase (NADP+) / methenyltetrahydrofolate cyclohydrolase
MRAYICFLLVAVVSHLHGMETGYTLLDGKKLAGEIEKKLKIKVANLHAAKNMKAPHLSIILVGQDPASQTYVKNKMQACKRVGFASTLIQFPETITQDLLREKIVQINYDSSIDALIVQLPLPDHINKEEIIATIFPEKDVDGLHPDNMGRLRWHNTGYLPATAYGILKLLKEYKIETQGKHCVVVGGSQIVGYPISSLLAREEYLDPTALKLRRAGGCPCRCTVTQCHKYTQDLGAFTRLADILIVAAGKHALITHDMVKVGAVVIDVGMHRIKSEKSKSGFVLEGDVAFETVKTKCSHITPVPGGVGPLTVATLLSNTFKAAQKNQSLL